MTTKLIQRHLFKGTQEFEIVDEQVNIRIKVPFKREERLSVMLTVLNPEPVISESFLSFTSRVNSEPLVSLYLGKPNTKEFNAFVATMKQKALDEYNVFAGLKPSGNTAALGGNVFDEPTEFDQNNAAKKTRVIEALRVEESIQLLEQNLDPEGITSLVACLNALKDDPKNEARLVDVMNAFHELGSLQGAVLTYAPYVGLMMADDPFNF